MCIPIPVSLEKISICKCDYITILGDVVVAYSMFILQVNISGNMQIGGKLLDEVIKLTVPKLFMIALAWLATRLFSHQLIIYT